MSIHNTQACRPRGCHDNPRFWQISYVTLSQPGGAAYAHHITTGTPGFSYLPTSLLRRRNFKSWFVVKIWLFVQKLYNSIKSLKEHMVHKKCAKICMAIT
jgi:hypothetical protein